MENIVHLLGQPDHGAVIVSHRGLDVRVPHEVLDIGQIHALRSHHCGEGMACAVVHLEVAELGILAGLVPYGRELVSIGLARVRVDKDMRCQVRGDLIQEVFQ